MMDHIKNRLTILLVLILSTTPSSALWKNATSLTILGQGYETSTLPYPYSRLPSSSSGVIRDEVYDLSLNSAGIAIDFQSEANSVSVKYDLPGGYYKWWHMAESVVSGIDLYVYNDGITDSKEQNTWLFVGHFGASGITYPTTSSSIDGLPGDGRVKSFRIHLPLYNTIDNLQVGVPGAYTLEPTSSANDLSKSGRILWYGTSIAQGCAASRPGNTFTNMIRNNINTDVLNLGFSGNCLMELDVASFLVQAKNVDLIVIDCLPNMDANLVTSNTGNLVNYVRQNLGDDVPIVLAEGTTYGGSWLNQEINDGQTAKRKALKTSYEKLLQDGVTNLHYVNGVELSRDGDMGSSYTVEGTHLTDVGHGKVAEYYSGVLPGIMNKVLID